MTEAQWTALISVLIPFVIALTALAGALTSMLTRQAAQHAENSERLRRIEEAIKKP